MRENFSEGTFRVEAGAGILLGFTRCDVSILRKCMQEGKRVFVSVNGGGGGMINYSACDQLAENRNQNIFSLLSH